MIAPLSGKFRALRELQAPNHIQEASDQASGFRVSSAAFNPGTDGSVSVDLEESLSGHGLPLTARFPAMPRAVAAVAVTVQTVRQHGLEVHHVPIEGNEHHGEIRDVVPPKSRSVRREIARKLAEQCEIIVPIDPQIAAQHQ